MAKQQQEAPKGLVAVFTRNGVAKSTGDLRYTLDPDASDVEDVEVKGRKMAVMPIPIGNGKVLRRTINRNVYVPADEADDSVESFTLRVDLDSMQRVTPKASQAASASDEGDAVLDGLVASGNVEALTTYLARTRDGIGPKSAKPIAEALIAGS